MTTFRTLGSSLLLSACVVLELSAVLVTTQAQAQGGDLTTAASAARPLTRSHRAVRRPVPVRAIVVPPNDYMGPHGNYGSPADMERSIEGTPCGEDCTRKAYERWNPGVSFNAVR